MYQIKILAQIRLRRETRLGKERRCARGKRGDLTYLPELAAAAQIRWRREASSGDGGSGAGREGGEEGENDVE
jgi:hypothetical protein